ncbi:MAG: branched-chain-amino-acid transaminase [Candidatus Omnitrophica bacterium]|nr:branched-chain-amino-acid transaminase [Candidatus Omnitrophota bacterium]MBU4479139.1 branched-chain-amino-acid transaminase [Candidatus Omnitrophota bacterium]MCG2702778.1 branched-chain-amino-acid transaminase [Candidatus Omnitrophota bacterium]
MSLKVYIDGKLINKEDAKVSVFDHGLLYGDGVFEGIRSYDCLVFKLKEHIDRLYESAHSILLEIPLTRKEMSNAVITTLKANKLKDAYIRLVVTRGEGDLGLDPRKCPRPTIIIITDKIVLYPEQLYKEGLKIITVPTVRNLPEALNPQIKSLNYLNNILAKIEAINSGVQEAIMLNSLGFVAECTGDNVFVVKNNGLYTPPPSMGILRGITRDTVIALAEKSKIRTCENIITRHEVFNADEVFLTGTAAELIPVVYVDGRRIGDGKPGKITLELMREFKKITRKEGVKYTVGADQGGKNDMSNL